METTAFDSAGVRCHAWHFRAADDRLAGPAGRPAVVMAHGFAGTKDSGLESFARHLAAAGAEVLAFDYRGFGASEGAPRQVISPAGQLADYRAALDAATRLPDVDPNRLVLWGVSMAGGTVLEAAAGRDDIAAVIALTPLVSGAAVERPAPLPAGAVPAAEPGWHRAGTTARLLLTAARDRWAAAAGRARITLPAVGEPGELALLTLPGATADYASIAGPTWRNEVAASIALDAIRSAPLRAAAEVRCPVLVQIADYDRYAPPSAAVKAAARARARVRHYPCDHFDVYPGKSRHELIREHQGRFLSQVLAPAASSAAR
ncbi:alpha/beta fold hydrolase [Nocardia sp. NPDC050697]|uniref:alpha/beta hydrolase n=1 Tax=Nocardia sp. NPDC050697 TaxID=3155158 RepID=UPI0033F47E20